VRQQWDKLHLRAWSWLKSKVLQAHVQFHAECDLVQYENKVEKLWETIHRILYVKTILKVLKNHSKMTTCRSMRHVLECQLEEIK